MNALATICIALALLIGLLLIAIPIAAKRNSRVPELQRHWADPSEKKKRLNDF